MSTVLRPKVPKTIPKSFDDDAVERLFPTLIEPDEDNVRAWQERDLAIVLTALLTGCRLSELVVMNIGDLRDVDGTGKFRAITVHGKGNKQRILTAEPALVDVLTAYLQSRLVRFPGCGKARSSATDSPWQRLRSRDPLFVGTDGERITGPTIQHRVERAYRRAGINGATSERRSPPALHDPVRGRGCAASRATGRRRCPAAHTNLWTSPQRLGPQAWQHCKAPAPAHRPSYGRRTVN